MQYELEALEQAAAEKTAGKGKTKPTEQSQRLYNVIEGHNRHISRLEQILRLLENDQVCPSVPLTVFDAT